MTSDVMATSAALAVVVHHSRHHSTVPSDYADRCLSIIAGSETALTAFAGLIAGAVSRTTTAPLDRLKTLAQEGRIGPPSPNTTELTRVRAIVKHLVRHDGIRGFWRGNGVNCLKAGPEYAIVFSLRQRLTHAMCSNPRCPSASENFAVGAFAGVGAQLVLYPLETTKTRMAVASRGEYTGITDCIRQSLRRGGMRDLYRGLAANLAGVLPHRSIEMGLYFTTEQHLRQMYGDEKVPLHLVSCASFGASVVSQIATYPLNLARTRLQTQGVNGRPIKYTSMLDCLVAVARESGWRGLFAGLAPNMLKAAPASTVMYTCFHSVRSGLEPWRAREPQHA